MSAYQVLISSLIKRRRVSIEAALKDGFPDFGLSLQGAMTQHGYRHTFGA
jgi:hypothetical protein